ncbi:MAG: acyl-ACP thioesterase domain-containing protein [Bacteroidales bacterium]|jgi:medium-chain acyl-[acyl-carrier-protein] hydrolase|nr:thioesterase [Bacteroidales bacterium]MDD2263704.1 thioesterase [Bacteroidales bacterium]MDD2831078.1 thioesterase [Bacteroidales bacterium]MDD3208114.1 thioesterase [Bacteroidales bacterium]MDD3696844.1 thioesterase [Bacteroidales bacterium]
MMRETRTITCYETDAAKNLKPFAFMNLAQEMANRDALEMGFGYDQLIEKQTIWVLSRMDVRYLRPPAWRENIVMETWHKGEDSIFSLRDFLIRNGNETEDLVKATSSWLIINIKTRRIQRTQNFFENTSLQVKDIRHVLETPCGKIPVPEAGKLRLVERKIVRYADIDFNLHVNNAKYMEWAMDCLETELVTSHTVKGFQINFNAEARLADTLDILVAETGPLSRYVEGRKYNKSVFQVQISFVP